jgi:ribosomal protein S18 acetylase RimI-like enzyme
MQISKRMFSRDSLPALIELISCNARDRWPTMTPLLPGDLAWQLPGSAPKDNLRLWYQGERLIGYAWFQPPCTFQFDVREQTVSSDSIIQEMLSWGESRQLEFDSGYPFYLALQSMEEWADAIVGLPNRPADPRRCLVTSSLENNTSRIAILQEHGYQAIDHFSPHLSRSLDDLESTHRPPGIAIRPVRQDELSARVEAHRDAWAPSTGFTLERYQQVRAITEIYSPDLDLVAVDDNERILSCAICWLDEGSKIGFFEPFGTRPEARGSGVSQLLIFEGLKRLRDRGMRHGRIYTAGFNHQAIGLYQSCGFAIQDRERSYLKQLNGRPTDD